MITIDKYLEEYREYMFTKDLIIQDNTTPLSRGDLYVISNYSYELLKSLLSSSIFLDTALIDIEKEIDDIYNHIDSKLDKILELAESYQNLNTNELLDEPIKSFSIFDIKSSENYNSFLKGITLKNTSKLKNKLPSLIEKSNKNAKEVYLFKEDTGGDLIQFKERDSLKTLLKTINVFDTEENLLDSYQDLSLIRLTKNTSRIEIITDNEDINLSSFTVGNIYNPFYQKYSSFRLPSIDFSKEGNLFKLNTSYNLPTDCYITFKLTFSYTDINTETIKQETIYTGINNSKRILVDKREVDTLGIDYIQVEDKKLLETDLIFVEPFTTNKEIIKTKGYNVIDITNINANNFNLSLEIDLYSLIDKNKTPLIEGIYGYVTK